MFILVYFRYLFANCLYIIRMYKHSEPRILYGFPGGKKNKCLQILTFYKALTG